MSSILARFPGSSLVGPRVAEPALRGIVVGVWLHQGAWAKLLRRDPRHLLIIERAVGHEHARRVAASVGAAEVGLAVWIASRRRPLMAAFAETLALVAMNVGGVRIARSEIPNPAGMVQRNLAFLGAAWVLAGLDRGDRSRRSVR